MNTNVDETRCGSKTSATRIKTTVRDIEFVKRI